MGQPWVPIVVGIAGGTGAGKSWLADRLDENLAGRTTRLREDWYYRDRSCLTEDEALFVNFDHPSAIDAARLLRDLIALSHGTTIGAPQYDYATHRRTPATMRVRPNSVVLIEGLFVLYRPELRDRIDVGVFIDVPAEVRLERRIQRDLHSRHIPEKETIRLWENFVCPMHDRFIEPSARHAHHIWRPDRDPAFPHRLATSILERLNTAAAKR